MQNTKKKERKKKNNQSNKQKNPKNNCDFFFFFLILGAGCSCDFPFSVSGKRYIKMGEGSQNLAIRDYGSQDEMIVNFMRKIKYGEKNVNPFDT